MTLYNVSGCKFYVGDAVITADPESLSSSDFSSVTWTEVKGWQSMGELGNEATVTSTELINSSIVRKTVGPIDAGNYENTFAEMGADAGQIAMKALVGLNANYPFKVEYNDDPNDGETSAPSMTLIAGKVYSSRRVGGEAAAVRMRRFNVAVENKVEVAAVSGA
jgi:hypothetical protein